MDDSFLQAYKKARGQKTDETIVVPLQENQTPNTPLQPVETAPISEATSASPAEQIQVSTATISPANMQQEEGTPTSPTVPNIRVTPVGPQPTVEPVQAPSTPASQPSPDIEAPTPDLSFLKNEPAQEQQQEVPSKPSKPPITSVLQSKVFLGIVALAGLSVVAILGFAVLRRYQATTVAALKVRPAQNAQVLGKDQELAESYIEEIGKIIALPEEEQPIGVATISDETKVKQNKEFFKNAKNGDVLVIYSTRAILYDPKNKVIVDVIPVDLQNQPTVNATESATPQQ